MSPIVDIDSSNQVQYMANLLSFLVIKENTKKCKKGGLTPRAKMRKSISNHIRAVLKNRTDIHSKVIGCNGKELAIHLESKFQKGMSWKNTKKWVIDHIIPLANFDLFNKEEYYKANHYSNLQPLWKFQNERKGVRIISLEEILKL